VDECKPLKLGVFKPLMQISIMQKRAQKSLRKYEGVHGFGRTGGSGNGNKKFDMNGKNAKTKLPKACPY